MHILCKQLLSCFDSAHVEDQRAVFTDLLVLDVIEQCFEKNFYKQ